jgi:excisionase family DNA binding protein
MDNLNMVRREKVPAVLPVSLRTIGEWQRKGILPFYKVGRTVMFKLSDLETALAKFRVAAADEPRPPKRRAGRLTPTSTKGAM